MPELPEVHALSLDLAGRLVGRRIARVDLIAFAALKTFDPPLDALKDAEITSVERHGKYLDIVCVTGAETLHLVMHLARAGWVRWRDAAPAGSARAGRGPLALRLVLAASDDHEGGDGFDVTEAGTKKSLAVHVVRSPSDVPGVARLGPDPLDPAFTLEVFSDILAAQGRAQIKGVLRSQSVIAGIGNAYSDEILHVARMSPFKPSSMTTEEVARLYDATQSTLREAISRSEGLAASELKAEKKSNLRVHGRKGEPCPVCGDIVRQVTYSDSSLQYCPTCQTGGRPLADRVLSRLLK